MDQAAPLGGEEQPAVPAPRKVAVPACRRRVLVLRHGSRPDHGADPSLDDLGFEQAKAVATYLAQEQKSNTGKVQHISAIYCSPFLRALQTAAPLSAALGVPIFVEWGFGELLAHGWLQNENPLPLLNFCIPSTLPMRDCIDLSYRSKVMPEYPDVDGPLVPGDEAKRARPLKRHGDALQAVLEHHSESTILIVAHGSTHDFVAGALCQDRHPRRYHTPAC
eukprot:2079365-Amphidinium_carterae.1